MGRITPFAPRILRGYPAAVAGLEEPELVLLLGLRWWVADARRQEEPMRRLGKAMAAVQVPDAAASLDMLMRVILRTACRPIELRCPHCPGLAVDEQRLLHVARLAQGHDPWLAAETLRAGMLTPQGAEFALGPLKGIGTIFAGAGLLLRPRALPEPQGCGEFEPWTPAPPPTWH